MDRRILMAWAGLPLLVLVYLWATRNSDLPGAAVAAQVVFLVAPALAAAFTSAAAWTFPRWSRQQLVWGLLTVATWILLLTESILSYGAVSGGVPAVLESVFDAVAFFAVVAYGLAVAIASGVDAVGWRRGLRITLDATALSAVGFYAVYALYFSSAPAVSGEGEAVRLAVYATLGMAIFATNALVFFYTRTHEQIWTRTLAAAMAFLSAGVFVWTVAVAQRSTPADSNGTLDMLSSVLFLIAYYVVFVAALGPVLTPSGRSRVLPLLRFLRRRSALPGMLLSTVVLVSVVAIGLSIGAEPSSRSSLVGLVALMVATVAVAGRTTLEEAETRHLSATSRQDRVSGIPGPRAIDEGFRLRLDESAASATPCVALVVDIDDFARVNDERGVNGGDKVLRTIASVVRDTAGVERSVFRLSGDEFLILGPVADRERARRLAVRVLNAVRAAVPEEGLTASVGFALYPDDAETPEALLYCADRAEVWVKRHGKNAVLGYERRMCEALDVDSRLHEGDSPAGVSMARALCAAADARDVTNHQHSRNVAALARLFAEHLGLDDDRVCRIEMAALLHDVGKIALPDSMLGERTLTARERRQAEQHTVLGERIVESLGVEGAWIRSHHERWDGNGYPDALQGADIPLESRIIALADAYDGMTTGRRYGAPMSKAAALQEIDLGMSTRFDPRLAETFIDLIARTDSLGWSDTWADAR